MSHELKRGTEYPYDHREGVPLRLKDDKYYKIARAIAYDCSDRRGIKQGFYSVDVDVREDIIDKWASIIKDADK